MTELTHRQLSDLTDGACILASGGGGPITMKDPMLDLIKQHGSVHMAELSQIPDDAHVIVLAGAGSPLALKQPGTVANMADAAYEALCSMEEALGWNADYLVAIETGVGNTLIPIDSCARKKIPVIDGAGARRSVPALTMCRFADLPVSPVQVAANATKVVGLRAPSAEEVEEPMMAVLTTSEFNSLGGIGFWPMKGSVAKKSVSPGTVSYTMGLGKALREAKDHKKDSVETVIEYTGGSLLFNGKIAQISNHSNDSFDFMTILLKDKSGKECRIYGQNESLIAWVNTYSHPVAMGPDLICYLTADGEVCSNADLDPIQKKGKKLAVIGIPCPDDLQTPGIQQAFLGALRSFGYGGPYVPLADLACVSKLAPSSPHAATAAGVPTRWWRNLK
jgi:DUF917 family protein